MRAMLGSSSDPAAPIAKLMKADLWCRCVERLGHFPTALLIARCSSPGPVRQLHSPANHRIQPGRGLGGTVSTPRGGIREKPRDPRNTNRASFPIGRRVTETNACPEAVAQDLKKSPTGQYIITALEKKKAAMATA